MRRIWSVVVAGLVAIAHHSAAAQGAPNETSPVLALDVAHVVTGGGWTSGEQDGVFRVIVRNHGWEHVSSTLTVEWLANDADSQETRVAQRRTVEIPDGRWSLGTPRLTGSRSGWDLFIEGTNPYTLVTRRWKIRLGRPGVVSIAARGGEVH